MTLDDFLKKFNVKTSDIKKTLTGKYALKAVENYGDALLYVKDQTIDICLKAVEINGDAIRFVDISIFKQTNVNFDAGYYLLSTPESSKQKTLVYIYDHPDFNGMQHISYGAHDGGGLMPISDLVDDVIVEPVKIVTGCYQDTTETMGEVNLKQVISEIVFKFAEILSSRPDIITCGSSCNASPLVIACKEYLYSIGVFGPDPDFNFDKYIRPTDKEKGV